MAAILYYIDIYMYQGCDRSGPGMVLEKILQGHGKVREFYLVPGKIDI